MRSRRSSRKQFRFQVTVVAGMLTIVALMAGSTVGTILSVARRNAEVTAERRFELASRMARERTVSLLQPAMDVARVAAMFPGIDAPVTGFGLDHPALSVFSGVLVDKPAFYSAYVGFSDGTFLQVIHAARNELISSAHDAPAETDLIIRAIAGAAASRTQSWTFLDANGTALAQRVETEFDYDPRTRPWYTSSLEDDRATVSAPYVFNSLKQPGITAASRLPDGGGVIGVDLTISSLTAFVEMQRISTDGGIALLTEDLTVVAASPGTERLLGELALRGVEPGTATIGADLVRTELWNVAANRTFVFISAAPLVDFMEFAAEMQRKILFYSSLILLVTIPLVLLWSRQLSRALKELAVDAERVSRMSFDGAPIVSTSVYEFRRLGAAFEVMKSTIAERTRRLEEALGKLEMLVEMGIAMSAEFDIDRLSEMILSNAKKLTNADGGSLYLVDEKRERLEFSIVLNDSLGFRQGGTSGISVAMSPVPLYDEEGEENHRNVVTHAFHDARTENIRDAYEVGTYDFSGTRIFDEQNQYRSVSFLTVPLKPRGGGDVLGALQLINAIDPASGEIVPFPAELESFVEALSSAAAIALQNWKLMERQKRLFDDLVRFVAITIDAKSPYTARHCERVPEIAKILARKAEEAKEGPFASFRFSGPAEQREFEVAAWLHDCGKVTTPEFVVDKATKLETIYNRIHEIRTRFEVLLRDARIERYEAILAGADQAVADRAFELRTRRLHDDFAFIAACNVGSEYMDDEELDRLTRIASTPWLRYFDNRLGLSWSEKRTVDALDPESDGVLLPVEAAVPSMNHRAVHRTAKRSSYGLR